MPDLGGDDGGKTLSEIATSKYANAHNFILISLIVTLDLPGEYHSLRHRCCKKKHFHYFWLLQSRGMPDAWEIVPVT